MNNALIYKDDNLYDGRHTFNNHNIELIDTNERPNQLLPINDIRINGNLDALHPLPHVVPGVHQLTTMEVMGKSNSRQYPYHLNGNNDGQSSQHNTQKDIVNLIQQTIRQELNTQQSLRRKSAENYFRLSAKTLTCGKKKVRKSTNVRYCVHIPLKYLHDCVQMYANECKIYHFALLRNRNGVHLHFCVFEKISQAGISPLSCLKKLRERGFFFFSSFTNEDRDRLSFIE